MDVLKDVEAALADIKAGKMIIVVDSEARENEGDLVMAAQKITAQDVHFMAKEGRGLICAPISGAIADKLQLPLMVETNNDPFSTNFTVSVDVKAGTTTGISTSDRAKTLQTLADPKSKAEDFLRPGHIFPLRAKPGGVLERPGHTEAAVDLSRLAGYTEVGVICEILKEDGEMARLPYLEQFARQHGLKILSIEALVKYRGMHT